MNQQELAAYHRKFPILNDICNYRETVWLNPSAVVDAENALLGGPAPEEIDAVRARFIRFRPLLKQLFPELQASDGSIISPLTPIQHMDAFFPESFLRPATANRFLFKRDDQLPVSGSIKARGGFYAVLKHAEQLALAEKILQPGDSYAVLATDASRDFFGGYSLSVGSTGNLGLSIGIMGARLGFRVSVHMSADARAWKKQLLRSHGVQVVEHPGDYGSAVAAGRQQALADPRCYFIDDENSVELFLGYSSAATELAEQLLGQGIAVDQEHPLFVYLPCGVGGGPGGITFGLKTIFGPAVHCFFCEPTHAPCMLVGLVTSLHDRISVTDIGLDGRTAADGLAVSRPSGFIGRFLGPWIEGVITVDDTTLFRLLQKVADEEKVRLEPSALAGLAGCAQLLAKKLAGPPPAQLVIPPQATHIIWATGGSMVPPAEMAQYYETANRL